MEVKIGGVTYKFAGIPFGTLPTWKLLLIDGVAMTEDGWNALSVDAQKELSIRAKHYARGLS